MSPDRPPATDPEIVLAIDLPDLSPLSGVVAVRLTEVDADLLARLAPSRVICPLMSPAGDALQIIAHLVCLGFGGPITVLAPQLPRPRMVERELRLLAAGAHVELIILPPDQAPPGQGAGMSRR